MVKKIISTHRQFLETWSEINRLIDGTPYLITFQKLEEKRRDVQNRRYWAIMHELAEQLNINEQQMSAETWHEWAKRRFIGVRELRLPDGEIIAMGMTSTDLTVAQFSDYMQMVEAWAVDHGVIFNDLPSTNIYVN